MGAEQWPGQRDLSKRLNDLVATSKERGSSISVSKEKVAATAKAATNHRAHFKFVVHDLESFIKKVRCAEEGREGEGGRRRDLVRIARIGPRESPLSAIALERGIGGARRAMPRRARVVLLSSSFSHTDIPLALSLSRSRRCPIARLLLPVTQTGRAGTPSCRSLCARRHCAPRTGQARRQGPLFRAVRVRPRPRRRYRAAETDASAPLPLVQLPQEHRGHLCERCRRRPASRPAEDDSAWYVGHVPGECVAVD